MPVFWYPLYFSYLFKQQLISDLKLFFQFLLDFIDCLRISFFKILEHLSPSLDCLHAFLLNAFPLLGLLLFNLILICLFVFLIFLFITAHLAKFDCVLLLLFEWFLQLRFLTLHHAYSITYTLDLVLGWVQIIFGLHHLYTLGVRAKTVT